MNVYSSELNKRLPLHLTHGRDEESLYRVSDNMKWISNHFIY